MRNNIFTQYQQHFKKIPHKFWIVGGVLLSVVIVYSFIFFVPKKVTFSYAAETCAGQLVLLPSMQQLNSDDFELTLKDELKIGSFTYAATTICAKPNDAPTAGQYTASVQPLSVPIFAKQLTIEVSEPPLARESDIIGKTISTALPLKVMLTSPDTIHTYHLSVADKNAPCQTESAELVCDVSELELDPGSDYTASLLRSYEGSDTTKLVEGQVETLVPIVLKKKSVKSGQTIYTAPKEFSFTFDRPVADAVVKLQQKQDKGTKSIETTISKEGNKLTVELGTDLERKHDFTLILEQVIADNGSSLEMPIKLTFATSGGPKPKSVSVGSTHVARDARIVVKLDQPIKDDVDLAKFARVEGASGSVSKQSATELVFSLKAGLCQQFNLVLDKGIASASNSATSDKWQFTGRTICGTSSVIGYSVQGRPIIAYYFGSGSNTILFTGGIHGEEHSAQQTMQAWADYLMAHGYRIPAGKRVVVVPNLNPDGAAISKRNNANNVNLGRNYPSSNWKASIETASGVLPKGGGTSAGSEPETKAIMALTQQLRPRLEVSFHAQGSLVGANKVADSVAIGNIYASTVGYGTMYYNAEAVMGYTITGEYEEWMGEKMGIPAILIELPSHYGNYLPSQLNALVKMLAV